MRANAGRYMTSSGKGMKESRSFKTKKSKADQLVHNAIRIHDFVVVLLVHQMAKNDIKRNT